MRDSDGSSFNRAIAEMCHEGHHRLASVEQLRRRLRCSRKGCEGRVSRLPVDVQAILIHYHDPLFALDHVSDCCTRSAGTFMTAICMTGARSKADCMRSRV